MVARAFIVRNVKGNMKKFLLLISFGFLLISCAQEIIENKPDFEAENNELTATDFVKGSEDIPLLNNLEIIEDSNNLDFDSASGSVSTIDYRSQIDLEAVQKFYLETLPQMGWKLVNTSHTRSSFVRENEKIEIEFVESEYEDEDDIVRFYLSSVTEEPTEKTLGEIFENSDKKVKIIPKKKMKLVSPKTKN